MARERLQKILSRAGLASRREAERWIEEGRVELNGRLVRRMGEAADLEHDDLRVDGRRVRPQHRRVVVALNKPREVITSMHDPQGRPTVRDLLKKVRERLYPVGRLDYESTGLVLLTNDGALTHALLHPSLGFENIETPLGDTSTHAAVLLELFGYERWRWRNGKASNRWGLSVTASYANIPGMDEMGYGFLVHMPIRNIAFGATYRDGDAGSEIGIVMIIRLSKFLQEFENIDLSDFLTP